MPAIITAIGGQKGGTGKSMLTGNLAACLATSGARVGIIDTDFSQNTVDKWHIARCSNSNIAAIECCIRTGGDIDTQLDEWRETMDYVFVDTNGSDSYELRKALTYADLFLSPIRPQASDNWTLGTVHSLYLGAREVNEALQCRIVISIAPTHSGRRSVEVGSTLGAIAQYPELVVCQTVISDRSAYVRGWLDGHGVVELNPAALTRDAIGEIRTLYEELYL
jgi:chromosome partitioning protein